MILCYLLFLIHFNRCVLSPTIKQLTHNFKLSKNVKTGIKCSIVVPATPLEGSIEKSSLFYCTSTSLFLALTSDYKTLLVS